jgi:uncharacterized protein (DUF1800 family)
MARGATDWISPLGVEKARVAHLLRRAAFGASEGELERALSEGYRRTVDRLLETPPAQPPPLHGGDDASRANPIKVEDLQRWWLDWMLTTPTPLAERMTLFWHGHFTSDHRKVGLDNPFLYWQNQAWRANSLGSFADFLYIATIDPAMLAYLDLGDSIGDDPNENYARELMELFSMGADTFSEGDVRASARALAGWRQPRTQAMVEAAKLDLDLPAAERALQQAEQERLGIWDYTNFDSGRAGIFVPDVAYAATVTFLGRTARFDTKMVVERVLDQPEVAPFVTRKLVRHFVSANPTEAFVQRLAAGFVRSRWSLRQLLHDVFTSPEFVAPSAYRSLIRSPVELMVAALKAVGGAARSDLAVRWGTDVGQVLFDMPDVNGWPYNEAWISSSTIAARINFVHELLRATAVLPSAEAAHAMYLDGVVGPATAAALNASSDARTRWFVVLASPEFQLK